jgi:hypothetical protein
MTQTYRGPSNLPADVQRTTTLAAFRRVLAREMHVLRHDLGLLW